jgi:plastocyanin
MKNLLKAAVVLSGLIAGTVAVAEEHEVFVYHYGMFPGKVYVDVGDTIKFINKGVRSVRLYSVGDTTDNYSSYNSNDPCSNPNSYAGSTDGWQTNYWSVNASKTIDVTSCMETTIEGPKFSGYYHYDWFGQTEIIIGGEPNNYPNG